MTPYISRLLAIVGMLAMADPSSGQTAPATGAIVTGAEVLVRSGFAGLAGNAGFQELLATDSHLLPPGAWTASRSYSAPYDGGRGKLLTAVLDALLTSGERFDPQIEVTPQWALVWGEMRIKVAPGPEGTGVVELSAPAERFTAGEWRDESERLFRAVTVQLVRRSRPP